MRLACDIEANRLIEYRLEQPFPEHVWCVVGVDIDNSKVYKFVPDEYVKAPLDLLPLSSFKKFSEGVTEWWFHNGLSYDVPVLNHVLGCKITKNKVYDTLIYSKMIDQNRKGGHSLKALGEMLGIYKKEFDDWSKFSMEQLEYCVGDVEVLQGVIKYVLKETKDFSPQSIRLEHDVRVILDKMERNGFYLDQELAQETYERAKGEADAIEKELLAIFTPRPLFEREFTPKATKSGGIAINSTGGYPIDVCSAGATYSRLKWKEFNIGSPMEKLWRLKGWWKPYVKTVSGKSWKICEDNLLTIHKDAPEGLKKLQRWGILNSRHKAIWSVPKDGKGNSSWIGNLGHDGRVHGYCDGIGAYTMRCSHSKPNMANVPGVRDRAGNPAILGAEMRDCWTVPDKKKYCIVGTDASGIQLRVLAHYINNPAYSKEVVSGDIHTANQHALGLVCKTRPVAKTFIYAWLLGAQAGKISSILSCTTSQARKAMSDFVKNIKGLSDLLYRKSAAARRGYMVGLDGRLIKIPSDHLSLPVYLQGGEATIMKLAMVLWTRWADKEKLDYQLCSFVHDEWQCQCLRIHAERLGKLQVRAIKRAGEMLSMNVPLDGEYKIGDSWKDTH